MLDVHAYGRVSTPIRVKTSKDKKKLYTSFLLASHDKKKEAVFIRCVAFDGLATRLNSSFSVGDRIILYGELWADDYKGQKNRFQLKINDFRFVETLAEHKKNMEAHSDKDSTEGGTKDDD